MNQIILNKENVGLLIVDVQEKLMCKMERSCDMTHAMTRLIKSFNILKRPILVTEQYPQGLGKTIAPIFQLLGAGTTIPNKTSFSCFGDRPIRKQILELPVSQWIVCGIEAHICVLQTARDLALEGKEVIVPNDAIGSQSIFDYSTAISEMKDFGIRVSSSETILFELIKDAKVPEFKAISQLVQCCQCETSCGG